MCRHCERIVEDVESKPIIHAFMADVAGKMTRLRGVRITADDIDVNIRITGPAVIEALRACGDTRSDAGMRLAVRATRMIDECFGKVGG